MVHKHGSLVQDVRRPARGTVHRVLNAMSYAIPNSHPCVRSRALHTRILERTVVNRSVGYMNSLKRYNCHYGNVYRTPPMGWMSWTQFKCQIDCEKYPDGCISEKLYKDMADQLGMLTYKDTPLLSHSSHHSEKERNVGFISL